ncbi:MAG: SIMPL domain-containing protein [Candidatus Protistobacter heckmanni]|nr:SIMPL domain-containing protein [Candidatus Protistobacter heckmanni]
MAPDVAVLTLLEVREGENAAALSQQVALTVKNAAAKAKAKGGIKTTTSYSTKPRYDNGKRAGWTVRGELTLKSRDVDGLGMVGFALADGMQFGSSGYEVSPELRAREEAKLQEQAIAAFRARAERAAQSFGYRSYAIRRVQLGQAGGDAMPPRPMMMMMKAMAAPAQADGLSMDSAGMTLLQLRVAGAVQMLR